MRRGAPARGLIARDHLDKAALVVAFLAGAAGAWGAKALGFGPFVAVGWTVAAMGFYVLAVTLLGRLRIEPEAIGDNCYYLGFLLTLSSLSATLWQLTQSGAQAEMMRAIIGGFGIALISTILGILLRVIFIQLRPDIVARDRETRIELSRAARELRLELATSAAAMKAFSVEAVQLAAEQGARTRAAAEAAAEAQRARMTADADTLSRTMEAAGARAVAAIGESVGRSAEGAQAAIAGSLAEMSRAIGEYAAAQAAAVDAREANEARAAAVGDRALARAAAVAAEVEALAARVTEAVSRLARELGASAEAIEAARDAAEAAAARAKAAEVRPAAGRLGRWLG